jgi:hypothetical protein
MARAAIDGTTATQWQQNAKDNNQLATGAAKAHDGSNDNNNGRRDGNGNG